MPDHSRDNKEQPKQPERGREEEMHPVDEKTQEDAAKERAKSGGYD